MTHQIGQVLTANRLSDGLVVFLARSGRWSDRIDEATVALEPEAAEALVVRGQQAEADNVITGVYLIEVERINGQVSPTHIRERIRTFGPTVSAGRGKPAESRQILPQDAPDLGSAA